MTRRNRAAAVLVVAVTMGACTTREHAEPATSTTTEAVAVATTAEPPEDTGNVPAQLTTIEAQAEDIIDVVPEGRWSAVAADVATTASAWDSYRAQAARDGAGAALVSRFDSALSALRAAADARRAAGTMQAANDLSAVVVDLFGLYHPPVPLDVSRFDVVGRQIILDVDAKDLGAAGTQIERIATMWSGLKADIVAHGGQRVATQTDGFIAALRAAHSRGDARGLRRQATDFLEVVDSMEQLYEHPS